MKLVAIAAVSVDGVIGIGDQIPWRIPEDFKHFRETTIGHVLLVGVNTFKTLPPKAHEDREFIILNDGERLDLKGVPYYQFSRLDTVLSLLSHEKVELDYVFVIGGASVYDQLIDYCDDAIITWVNKTYPEGDKKFPITKLFANFDVYSDQDWQRSKTGLLYKVTYYRRSNGSQR
jgi:dihydrofolate reductase